MSQLGDKIRSKGYWSVYIRPTRYIEKRIPNIAHLTPLVQRLSVRLRRWEFPHVDPATSDLIGADWVGQDQNSEPFIERWRLFQSGQLGFLGAFWTDWSDLAAQRTLSPFEPTGPVLFIEDIITRFLQYFSFASALALSEAGDGSMFVQIAAHGLDGRHLSTDSHTGMMSIPSQPRVATIPEYIQKREFSREELSADSDVLALSWSLELFRRFGWDPAKNVLESLRQKIH